MFLTLRKSSPICAQNKQNHPSPCPAKELLLGKGRRPARPLCPQTHTPGRSEARPLGTALHAWDTSISHPQHGGERVRASHCQGTFTFLMAKLRYSPPSREKHCETNPNYPCCSTLGIKAEFAAGTAHLLAPAAPQHSWVKSRFRHHQPAGLVGPRLSGQAGPCLPRLSGFRADRSRQRQILQLLQLAQAASDYLKPQPFFYERRAPDVRPIDLRLLKQQPGPRKRTLPSAADNGAYF